MSEPVQFVFSRQRLVVLTLCAVTAGALLFGAGVATGLLLSSGGPERHAQLASEETKPVPHASSAPAVSAPQEKQAAEHADSAPIASEKVQGGLVVDVASFQERSKAANLAAMLRREGFGPVHLGQYETQGQTMYSVRVGPFAAWEEASRIATELDESFDLHSSVIPAKAAS